MMSGVLEPLEFLFDFSYNCDECQSRLLISLDGFKVCSNCGLEHGPLLKQRADGQTTIHVEKYRWIPTDFYGSVFKPISRKDKKMYYFHLYCSGLNDHFKKAVTQVFVICDHFQLPHVVYHRAAKIYNGISDGRDHKALALVAASVLKASKEYKYPLLYSEVLDYFEARGHKVFIKDIRKVFEDHRLKMPLLKPVHYTPMVLSKVQRTFPALEAPLELIYEIVKLAKHYPTRNPHMFAIACVALAYSISYDVAWSSIIGLFVYHYRTVSTLMKELHTKYLDDYKPQML